MKCKIKGLECVYEHQVIAHTIMHSWMHIDWDVFDTLSLGFNRVLSSETYIRQCACACVCVCVSERVQNQRKKNIVPEAETDS